MAISVDRRVLAAHVPPVPGGVGPMPRAMWVDGVCAAARLHRA